MSCTLVRVLFRHRKRCSFELEENCVKVVSIHKPKIHWQYYNFKRQVYILSFAYDVLLPETPDLVFSDLPENIKFNNVEMLPIQGFYRGVDVLRHDMEFFSTSFYELCLVQTRPRFSCLFLDGDNNPLNGDFYIEKKTGIMHVNLKDKIPKNTLFVLIVLSL